MDLDSGSAGAFEADLAGGWAIVLRRTRSRFGENAAVLRLQKMEQIHMQP